MAWREVAELPNLCLGHPLFSHMIEVAHDMPRRQTTVHLDAVVEASLGSVHDLMTNVGTLDANIPPHEHGKVFTKQHCDRIAFLAGRAGCTPEAQSALLTASFDQRGKQLGSKQLEGAPVAKEAGLIDGHRLGDGPLQGWIFARPQAIDEFLQMRDAFVAQQLCQPRVEKVVAGRIEHVAGEARNDLAQITEIDGCRCSDHFRPPPRADPSCRAKRLRAG